MSEEPLTKYEQQVLADNYFVEEYERKLLDAVYDVRMTGHTTIEGPGFTVEMDYR